MDLQKELELFLDYYMPNQSSDIRDAVELDKRFHVINVPKLLAVSGLDESYVLRLKDSWNAWKAAKAQAVPDGFVVVPKELSDEKANKMAKDEFSKISSLFYMEHRSEPDNSVEQLKRIWIANKIRNLKLFHKLFIGAQEQSQ